MLPSSQAEKLGLDRQTTRLVPQYALPACLLFASCQYRHETHLVTTAEALSRQNNLLTHGVRRCVLTVFQPLSQAASYAAAAGYTLVTLTFHSITWRWLHHLTGDDKSTSSGAVLSTPQIFLKCGDQEGRSISIRRTVWEASRWCSG